jgi:hypothetical protein
MKPASEQDVVYKRSEESPRKGLTTVHRAEVAERIGAQSDVSASATLKRFGSSNRSSASRYILRLQQQYGNRYVQRALAMARREADGQQVAPEVESTIERKRGGGQGLDSGVRTDMESFFGSDFRGVRVHTDGESDALNRAVNAVAFTTGQDIFFGAGKYNPEQSAGKELLAHELTHVVQQQGGSTIHSKLALSDSGSAYEQEADAVGREVASAPSRTPAVELMAKGDEPTPSGSGPSAPAPSSGTAPSGPAPTTPGTTQAPTTPGGNVSGTIADIVTRPGEGRSTAPEQVADQPMPPGPGNVVANLSLNFTQPKSIGGRGSKQDSVTSGVTVGPLTQPGGRAVSPFGAEFYEPAFTGISYAFAGGKCTITATLNVICPWGTASGGDTDVPSATSAVVTATSWPAIKADLAPSSTSPFKSPRTKYYSQALVERHEKFHGTDDLGWTQGSGIGIVKTFLEAGTVSSATAAADVNTLLSNAKAKLIAENLTWYKGGGTSHDSYAGEIRAYADGRPHYQALADAVEAHGKTLKPPSHCIFRQT